MPTDADAVTAPTADVAAALAADLRDAGFTSTGLRAAWGDIGDEALARGLRGPALTALADSTEPVAVLARVLALGVAEPATAVEAALPRAGTAGLVARGLAAVTDGVVTPLAMVRPQAFADGTGAGEWLIASDLDEAALAGPLPPDHVLGVGGASMTLAALQLPGPVEAVLDLGTGCGIQALRALRDAGRVVATDISERALGFARLNLALNAAPEEAAVADAAVELRRGDLFTPVGAERFDRIVSNPPFVITPRVAGVPAYEYRDAGYAGDDLVAAVIAGVGAHLVPGGVALMLANWEYRADAPGLARVRAWVAASAEPLDAWVIERDRLDPLAYAELWVRDGGTVSGTAEYAGLVDAWLGDFASRGVSGVGFGYVVLRRRAAGGVPLARYEELSGGSTPFAAPLGEHLAASLDTFDRLSRLDDAALAASVFTVAADVTEARHHLPGAADPSVIELRQGGGFGRVRSVDTALAAVVGACDGDLPLGAIVDAVASLLEVDAAALRAEVFPAIRELAFCGFVTVAG